MSLDAFLFLLLSSLFLLSCLTGQLLLSVTIPLSFKCHLAIHNLPTLVLPPPLCPPPWWVQSYPPLPWQGPSSPPHLVITLWTEIKFISRLRDRKVLISCSTRVSATPTATGSSRHPQLSQPLTPGNTLVLALKGGSRG